MKKDNIIFLLNILLGSLLFLYVIWFRFIRIRLPKDIPFNLFLLSFIIILFIICIYCYQLIQLLNPIQLPSLTQNQKASSYIVLQIKYFLQLLYKPLTLLQETIINYKHLYPLWSYLVEHFIQIFIYFKLYKGKRYIAYNIICYILPRFIITIFFFIDVFYFHKLEKFYIVLPLGIVPLIFSFVNACVITILEKNTQDLEKNFIVELNTEDQTEDSNYYFDIEILPNHEDYEYNEDQPNIRLLNVRYFIDIQAGALWNDNDLYKYKCIETWEARINYAKKHNIELNPKYVIISNQDELAIVISKLFYTLLPYMINLRLFLNCQKNNLLNAYFRNSLKIIYGLYILCWSYILITGNYDNVLTNLLDFLENFYEIIDPFSGAPISIN